VATGGVVFELDAHDDDDDEADDGMSAGDK
jgi:hypothetical protein